MEKTLKNHKNLNENLRSMKQISQLATAALFAIVLYACGGAEGSKMDQLQALKDEKSAIEAKISALEAELIASGELKPKEGNKVLVAAKNLKPGPFFHEVEFRGAVSSRKNVTLTPEMIGKVTTVKISEGQRVKKGQLLVTLDAEVIRNNIAEVETQLDLAQEVFERQSRLWDQNIGTEIQFLQAKNGKESLERRLATLRSQLAQSMITAPFDAVIDDIPVKVGELVQPGIPVIRLINPNETYISADVSESFLGRFSEGQGVNVYFPSQDKKVNSTVKSLGKVIKSENRTFEIEIELPSVDFPVQPNQVVVLKLVDYKNDKALTVPTKLIQSDNQGNFVYVLKQEGGKTIAKKAHIEPGVSYNLITEVKSGLTEGQMLAYDGYRELSENALVTLSAN